MSETWEQKTARWAAEATAIEKRDAELRRHAKVDTAGRLITEPRAGEPIHVQGPESARLMVRRVGNTHEFFAMVEGHKTGRFGTWSQIKADIGYFVLNGTLPRGESARW